MLKKLLLVFIMILNMIPTQPVSAIADEFDQMRSKWRVTLVGSGTYDTSDANIALNIADITGTAQDHWNAMNKGSDRKSIWPYVVFGNESRSLTTTYKRLEEMTIAYSTVGSPLYNNSALFDDIMSALDWMYERQYNENKPAYQNWWPWQIGAPMALNNITVLLYDKLSAEQITNYMNAVGHFQPDVTMTGANRIWECKVIALRGIIVKDSECIAMARDGLSQVFGYVTSGDGFYTDGAFIQHNYYPYTGGYGKALIYCLSDVMYVLHGSSWESKDIGKSNVFRWIYDSYAPMIYKGMLLDMVRGREISRYFEQGDVAAHDVMSAIVRLSQLASHDDALALRRMIKYWLQNDTTNGFYIDVSTDILEQANAILNNPDIPAGDEPVGHYQFPNMDRTVHQRPGFAFAISMYSSRLRNYESINSENARGWHTADGMTYLLNNDLQQFSGDFWPTVDSYRLPGTTVLQNTATVANKLSDKNWVGGTDILNQYGVTGMEFHPSGQSLNAKKSWFMFDDEIVSLGAGITSTDGIPVETIIENRKINENNAFIKNEDWAHLSGGMPGTDIGYHFPEQMEVNTLREQRTDNWKKIKTDDASIECSNNFQAMWVNHGVDPQNSTYSYVTLPNKTAEETGLYSAAPDIEILVNSPEVQAVRENKLNIIGANFWTDTRQTADIITCDKKAAVMTHETAEGIEVSVSDPTQVSTSIINIELNRSAFVPIVSDHRITITQLYPTIKFSVDVNGASGQGIKVKFSYAPTDIHSVKDEYIIDNTDAGFSTDSTAWSESVLKKGFYGSNYLEDGTTTADSDRWAKWTPSILKEDSYDIYIRWVSGTGRPSDADVEIKHAYGIDRILTANQLYNNGVWLYLGRYSLPKGDERYVKLYANGADNTSADAVKFTAVNETGNIPITPIRVETKMPTTTYTMIDEDFQSGLYSVSDILNGQNIYKKLFQKDGDTLFTGEMKTDAMSFSNSIPEFDADFLEHENDNTYFTTSPGRMTHASGAEDVRFYLNFPEKFTAEKAKGLINVDVKLRKATDNIFMNICQESITSYTQSNSAGKAVSITLEKPSLSFVTPAGKKVASTASITAGEWVHVRAVIDLSEKQVTLYYGESLESLRLWMGANNNSTFSIPADINGISSIYFNGKGSLSIDDIKVYATSPTPEINDVRIEDGALKSANLVCSNLLPSTITVIATIYNPETSIVEDVEVINDISIEPNASSKSIHFTKDMNTKGKQLKIFVWGNIANIKPLATYYTY